MAAKARLGVIGAGWWSTLAHLPAIRAHPEAELVALADVRPEALAKARAVFGPVAGYTDPVEMLKREALAGVVVAIDHSAHYAVARQCLAAGAHVLLEKPMTLTAVDARRLQAAALARGRELIIGYPYHYNPATAHARAVLRAGWLGRIQYVTCLFASMVIEFYRGNDQAYGAYPVTGPGRAYTDPKRAGGGQGHLQVTHAAALLFHITGLRPARVTAFMENWDVPVDLVNAIAVRFQPEGGAAAIGVVGSTGNVGVGGETQLAIEVYCEHGQLRLDQSTGTVTARHHNGDDRSFGPVAPEARYPRAAPVNNLVDVIQGRDVNRSPAEVGAVTVELIEAAYRSAARQGKPVEVASLYPRRRGRAP